MKLETNLAGRLRNINLPKTNVLYPLFEAVINSIHSIDDRIERCDGFTLENSSLKINILRSPQKTLNGEKPDIEGFEIIDNGNGFNESNYRSFQMLDSDYKIQRGCKGVGRLLWLKVFEFISIKSSYMSKNGIESRSFNFSPEGISNEIKQEAGSDLIETRVILKKIKKEYSNAIPQKISKIGRSLLEHCLWYFLRDGGAPNIIINDGGQQVDLNKDFEAYMQTGSAHESINIKGQRFDVLHLKLKLDCTNKNTISYNAANRLVKREFLKDKIPGLFGQLKDGEDNFSYMCFVSSDYLTNNVTQERSDFSIPEKPYELLPEEISFSDIRGVVVQSVKQYLEPFLSENRRKGKEKFIEFINKKAPRYRPILNRLSEEDQIVDPEISDKDLELKLHKNLTDLESEMLSTGHDLMKPSIEDNVAEYSQKLKDYLSQISDLKQSDLAGYVAHRKIIIDLFEHAIKKQPDGKYSKEDVIHKLLMPMRKTSNDVLPDDCNFWLLDERLSFHNYLASDKKLDSMDIIDTNLAERPDIMALNVYDNPLLINDGSRLPLASITVVELKRPMRNDAVEGVDKDPIEQALDYLEKVRKGGVKTAEGREIPDSQDIPGFCYVLCDLTHSMIDRCRKASLKITADKMGYFGYNDNYKAYIEVISFDRLLNAAKERNKAFFEKLGLPTN